MYCPTCGAIASGTHCGACGAVLERAPRSGWWRRVAATVVDNLLLLIPTTALLALLPSALGTLAALALQGAYQIVLLAGPRGQTVGNRLAGTRVRSISTDGPITVRQASWRWGIVVAYSALTLPNRPLLTALAGGIGLFDVLFPLANAERQTIHDRIAATVVVRV